MSAMQDQFVVDTKGKKTGVILSLKRYEQLKTLTNPEGP
jgi:hypothetical protein